MIKNVFLILFFFLSSVSFANNPTSIEQPVCLDKNVNFWYDMFTVYTKQDLVVFNKKTLEIYNVYEKPSKRVKKFKKHLIRKYSKNLPKSQRQDVDVRGGAQGMFKKGYLRMSNYRPEIIQHLKENNIPSEIVSLVPFIESAYWNYAISNAGAVGMWQIMPATARAFGVKKIKKLQNEKIATRTAIKILKHNYELLGDWTLAINAYHSGVGRLLKASKAAQSKNLCDILDHLNKNNLTIKGYKFYSRNYVAQIFALDKAIKALSDNN